MNFKRWSIPLFIVSLLCSCSREDVIPATDSMVKTVDSVSIDVNIGLLPLDDGSYVVVSQGQMVKVDSRGNIAWKKPIPEFSYLRAGVAIPGTGFALFGMPVHPQTNSSFYAGRYDREGNFLDGKQVNINTPYIYSSLPVSLIRLSNGGFALGMSSSYTYTSYLKILDADFNLVYSRGILAAQGYHSIIAQNICEMPGGGIAMVASMGGGSTDYAYLSYALILTEPDTRIKSFAIVGDSTYNTMPLVVSAYEGGFFATTSTMTGWASGDGSFVTYYGPSSLAGTMHIDVFNPEGQLMGNRGLTGYPGYGLIKTIRPTPDGGYILCGTTGNNGSTVSVSKTKVYVCKLDAGLNEVWTRVIETPYQAVGVDAVPASDGSCLVVGNLKSFNTDYQMLLVKTDANGNY